MKTSVELDDEYFSSLENNILALSALYPRYKGEMLEFTPDSFSNKSGLLDQKQAMLL